MNYHVKLICEEKLWLLVVTQTSLLQLNSILLQALSWQNYLIQLSCNKIGHMVSQHTVLVLSRHLYKQQLIDMQNLPFFLQLCAFLRYSSSDRYSHFKPLSYTLPLTVSNLVNNINITKMQLYTYHHHQCLYTVFGYFSVS